LRQALAITDEQVPLPNEWYLSDSDPKGHSGVPFRFGLYQSLKETRDGPEVHRARKLGSTRDVAPTDLFFDQF
jgi:hypothetical protein